MNKTELELELEKTILLLEKAYDHLNYCGYGDSWEQECALELRNKLDEYFRRKGKRKEKMREIQEDWTNDWKEDWTNEDDWMEGWTNNDDWMEEEKEKGENYEK